MSFLKTTTLSATLLALPITLHALNPIQGWYGGLLVGGNYSPSISFLRTNPFPNTPNYGKQVKETLSYSNLGDIGGDIGYRIENYRIEGEFVYNNIPYNGLNIGDIFITGPNSSGGGGTSAPVFINGDITTGRLQFQGSTSLYAGFLNGYYDFFYPNYTDSFVPFIGGGVGYGLFQNWIQFLFNGNDLANANVTKNSNAFVWQGIFGISYYLDDYSAFALDFRYISGSQTTLNTYFMTYHNVPQIYTLNLTFNGSFNL